MITGYNSDLFVGGTTSFDYMDWTITLRYNVCIPNSVSDSLATSYDRVSENNGHSKEVKFGKPN